MKKNDFAFYVCVVAICVAIAYLLTRCGSGGPSDMRMNSNKNYVISDDSATPDDSAGEAINASNDDSKSRVTDRKHKKRTASKASGSRNKKSSIFKKRRNGADNATEGTPDSRGQKNSSSDEENQSSPPIGDAQNDSITDVQNQPEDAFNDSLREAPVDNIPENGGTTVDEEELEDDDGESESSGDDLLNDVLNDLLNDELDDESGEVEYDGMVGYIVYDTARVWKRTMQPYYQRVSFGGEKKLKKVAEIYCIFLSNSYEFTRTSYFADRDSEIEEQGTAHVSLIRKDDIVIAKIFVCEKGWKVIEIVENLSR